MEPWYHDAAGHIDCDAIKAHAGELRREAIDAFWSELFPRAAIIFAKLRRSAAAHMRASAIAHLGNLRR